MKRYRIFCFDFDSRAILLKPFRDDWRVAFEGSEYPSEAGMITRLMKQYGDEFFDRKFKDFVDVGVKPFSVVSFHNKFLSQIRSAFIHGQYYPALTGACALGERILNHLMKGLRHSYCGHDNYKKIYRKESFDYWPQAIDALNDWGVLTPEARRLFCELNDRRNFAIHFNEEVDFNDRQLSLDAIRSLEGVIDNQFSSFNALPWVLPSPGESYIRKDWEDAPFIKLVYLPNCMNVGYMHKVVSVIPLSVEDRADYPEKEVSDDEFVELRKEHGR
ncbi:hypothetical protein [Chitinilyticum aquatile]|uniref:hypothetical protein n=1 Tax=Chitinilyticum aquatile TaxID=362520 RepID=UPI0012DC2E1B|nr:hypothetical protein [Chitinilyticum aquatile]